MNLKKLNLHLFEMMVYLRFKKPCYVYYYYVQEEERSLLTEPVKLVQLNLGFSTALQFSHIFRRFLNLTKPLS